MTTEDGLTPVDMTELPGGTLHLRDVQAVREQLEDLLDRAHPSAAVRWDVATLTAAMNLMSARVPVLRYVLHQLAAEGRVTVQPAAGPGADTTYLTRAGSVGS